MGLRRATEIALAALAALVLGSSCTLLNQLPDTCEDSCEAAANATAACSSKGRCEQTCLPGFSNCDGDDENGCETETRASSDDCGSCGHSCWGGSCVESRCQPYLLANNLPAVIKILASDDGTLLVLALGTPEPGSDPLAYPNAGVVRLEHDDPTKSKLIIGPAPNAIDIAADGADVYLTFLGTDPAAGEGSVVRVPRTTPDTNVGLVSVAALQESPTAVTVDGTHVYWASALGVHRRAKDLASPSEPVIVALPTVSRLDNDQGYIYWTESVSHRLRRAAKATGIVEELAAPPSPFSLLLTSTHVYWSSTGVDANLAATFGMVSRVPLFGGETQLLGAAEEYAGGIALFGPDLYWASWTPTSYAVSRRDANGDGNVEVVAKTTEQPFAVGSSARGIYWSLVASGTIYFLAP